MKALALAVGVLIAVAGLGLIVFPGMASWLAAHPLTRLELYTSATVRVAIGIVLISAAKTARFPNVLRVLGAISILAGVATLFIGVDRARAIAHWTLQQDGSVIRLVGLLPLALGALIVFACGRSRPVGTA